MKKTLIPLTGLIIAIAFIGLSSFNKINKARNNSLGVDRYAVWNGVGAQDDPANYPAFADMPTTPPETGCNGDTRLCWFRVADANNSNSVDATEFDNSFEAIDNGALSGNGSLNEETEQSGILEKRN